MAAIRVKGFKIFKDRHGKSRCYHRATGTAIDLTKCPLGSAEFFAECAKIAALADKAGMAKPGTLGKLTLEYKKHAAFTDLAARTKSDYERYFELLRPIFDTPLIRFTPPLIVKIRDKIAAKHGWRTGNYLKTVIGVIFAWGRERGFADTNPAAGIKALKRPKGAEQPNRPWEDFERAAVLEALPPHMILPFALMMFCGLDPIDTVSLPRSAIKDGLIDTRRAKTAQPVWIPLPEPVKVCLAAQQPHSAITLCVNSRGLPWTTDGLNSNWQRLKKHLEATGEIGKKLTLKGLRHTVATILAEMGHDDRTIADMLGQRTLAMAQHYSNRANRSRKLSAVVKNLDAEMNKRRLKIVKPA